ncbi:MAG: succinate dehydrogenase/fumarate reductase iron-sulfur subunit [Bacteriovoracaceae bacterium]|nr:succinate dehydrogenase/fumarate reductase iron-sulfur subunit [Bacteriovoracaceae bacterium]
MTLYLQVWRQKNSNEAGAFSNYEVANVSPDMSFLEMLDMLNEDLARQGLDPIQYDHDCREGICGACGVVINGEPHGPGKQTTTCELHMRNFKNGDAIVIEPWRVKAFAVLKDLAVDRSAYDKIIQAGGFIKVNYGNAPEANSLPVGKDVADLAMDMAACIGCGACAAACKNASAMLFAAAKISHLALLPQGQVERKKRAANMIKAMDELGFGNCTNQGLCEDACPKGININAIARLNREYLDSILTCNF